MTTVIKTKQDFFKALNTRDFNFTNALEVVNDADLRVATDNMRGLLRQNKKLEIVILERN